MKLKVECDWCKSVIYRTPSHIKKHNFCCRECLAKFSNRKENPEGYAGLKDYSNISRHCTEMNKQLNPDRMTDEIKEKISQSRIDTGRCVSYRKKRGRHEHRTVAEQILGRPLLAGEVVHHRDGNKRNNSVENIVVFASQREHAKHHAELSWFLKQIELIEGGDAE